MRAVVEPAVDCFSVSRSASPPCGHSAVQPAEDRSRRWNEAPGDRFRERREGSGRRSRPRVHRRPSARRVGAAAPTARSRRPQDRPSAGSGVRPEGSGRLRRRARQCRRRTRRRGRCHAENSQRDSAVSILRVCRGVRHARTAAGRRSHGRGGGNRHRRLPPCVPADHVARREGDRIAVSKDLAEPKGQDVLTEPYRRGASPAPSGSFRRLRSRDVRNLRCSASRVVRAAGARVRGPDSLSAVMDTLRCHCGRNGDRRRRRRTPASPQRLLAFDDDRNQERPTHTGEPLAAGQ